MVISVFRVRLRPENAEAFGATLADGDLVRAVEDGERLVAIACYPPELARAVDDSTTQP